MEMNYVAIVVSGIVAWVLGMIWYAPPVFGKSWMAEAGIGEDQMKSMKSAMFFGLVSGLVTSYVVSLLLGMTGVETMNEALTLAFWLWLGFVATVGFGVVVWEGKSTKLFFINSGYQLVMLLVVSGILVSWA